jgi:hypothetical protein
VLVAIPFPRRPSPDFLKGFELRCVVRLVVEPLKGLASHQFLPPSAPTLRAGKELSYHARTQASGDRGECIDCTAAATWEDSNFHITISENAFEMSTEFPLFWPKFDLETFAAMSCDWQGRT